MRCSVCDYSSDTPSHFYSGLVASHWSRMQVRYSKTRDIFTCDACNSISGDALSEMINVDEEYVFNSIEPKVKKRA